MELQANGITVYYEAQGTGPTVTLVHALGVDQSMWWQQVPALALQYRTLTYDVRGHGRSSKPRGRYSLETFAADLRALLAQLGVSRTHLVGISMGGMIAQALALQDQSLLASLTLVDTSSEYGPDARQLFEQRAALVEAERMLPIVEPTLDRWFTAPFRERYSGVVDLFRRTLLRNEPGAYAAAARAVADLNFTDQLNQLRLPTLAVVGEQDQGTPVAMAETIHKHIAGSRLEVIPNAAHLTPVERPDEFNKLLLEFLAGV